MYQKITTTIICALLMGFSVIAAPSLDLLSLPISILSLAILFFALKGTSRFHVTLILIGLSLLVWGIANFASNEAQKLATDVLLYQRNSLEYGVQFAGEFRSSNFQNAKYFEVVSNYSFVNSIMAGIFSLIIPKNNK